MTAPADTLRRHPVHRRRGFATALDLLRERAAYQAEDRACVILGFDGGEAEAATYAELDRRARAVAAALQEHASEGDRALILLPTGLDFAAAFFGCLYAGVIAVPVPPPDSRTGGRRQFARLQQIAKDAGPAVVLSTTEVADDPAAAEWGPAVRLAVDGIDPERSGLWKPPAVEPGTIAFLQYTSGSTGDPKGAVITHGNLVENLAALAGSFRAAEGQGTDGQKPQDFRTFSWLPLFHDMGLSQLMTPLYVGGYSVLMPSAAFLLRPMLWPESVGRYHAVASGGPNFAYEMCAAKASATAPPDLDLSSWKFAFNGAEPVRWQTLRRFASAFAPYGFRESALMPSYGLAEGTVYASGAHLSSRPRVLRVDPGPLEQDGTVTPVDEQAKGRTLVGCGWVPENLDVRIVDARTGEPCPPERAGEIWISGGSIAQGYWGQPEATAAKFGAVLRGSADTRYLRTGDLGFVSGGELYVIGRADDVIVVDGRNHFPQDIEETVVHSHAAVTGGRCAAFAYLDGDLTKVGIAVETARGRRILADGQPPRPDGSGTRTAEVIRDIRRRVAEEHQLSVATVSLLRPGALPVTTSGKVQRRACRLRFLAQELKTW